MLSYHHIWPPVDFSSDESAYCAYEFGAKATVFAFNISLPLLVSSLGDSAFGLHSGRIAFSCVVAVVTILTSLSFLTFTSIMEYENIKKLVLFRLSVVSSICLILFVFCFNPATVYLALILLTISRVSLNIAFMAYDSLLDAASYKNNVHSVSSRATSTGYLGMTMFSVFLIPIELIAHYVVRMSSIWTLSIIPSVFAGLWLYYFVTKVEKNLSNEFGIGICFSSSISCDDNSLSTSTRSLSDISNHENDQISMQIFNNTHRKLYNMDESSSFDNSKDSWQTSQYAQRIIHSIRYGIIQGFRLQYENILEITKFKDLCLFITGNVFLQGAAITAQSVAIIIATQILNAHVSVLFAALLCGIISAVFGVLTFKHLINVNILSPKQSLIVIVVIFGVIFMCLIYATNTASILIVASLSGFAVGPYGALSRSIASSIIPRMHQSRFFSLYQFSVDSTSWIGSFAIATVSASLGGSNRVYIYTIALTCLAEIIIGLPFLLIMNYKRGLQTRQEADIEELEIK